MKQATQNRKANMKPLEIMWRIMIHENLKLDCISQDPIEDFEFAKSLKVYPIDTNFCTAYDDDSGWWFYKASGGVIISIQEGGNIVPEPGGDL